MRFETWPGPRAADVTMSLTQQLVDTLLYEGRSRIGKKGRKRWSEQIVWDDEVPALGLKVSHTNRKTFVVAYRSGGRKRRKTLGNTTALTLAEARQRAAELLEAAGEQRPAAGPTRPARSFATVKELGEAWIEHLEARQQSCFVEQRMLRTHVQPALGRAVPSEVSLAELGNLKRRVRRQFPNDGRRLPKVLDALFAWAEEQGAWAPGRQARASIAEAGRAAGKPPAPPEPAAAEPDEPAQSDAEPTATAATAAGDDREQLAERLQEMSVLGAEMMANLNEQAASRQRLEKELAALRDELEKARRQPERSRLEEVQHDAETLRGTVAQLMEQLKKAKGETRDLRGQLEQAETAGKDFSRRVAAVAAERNALEDRLREAQGRSVAATQRLGRRGLGRGAALVGGGVLVGILLSLLWPGRAAGPGTEAPRPAGVTAVAGRAPAPVVEMAPPEDAEPATAARGARAAPAPASPAAEPPPTAVATRADPPATPPEPVDGPDPEALEPAVRAWAAAWQEQRVADYLAAYSTAFEPPGGLSREQWAAQRTERIRAPAEIRLDLGPLAVTPLTPGRVRVAFDQRYATESYRDQVRKVLELVWEEGGWRIAVERSG